MNKSESQLIELLDAVLCGSQTDSESEALRQLVDAHPKMRPFVVEQLRTHSLLQWHLAPTAAQAIEPEVVLPKRSWTAGRKAYSLAAAAALAIAASLLLTVFPAPVELKEIGRLVSFEGAEFSSSTTSIFDTDRLAAGLLEIESGRISIELSSGVEMEIDGPSLCKLDSDMHVHLIRGQATAQVPRWARGFTIATSDIEVVDLGTRFGVAKHEDCKTDVVVFEGEVDMNALDNSDTQFQRRLTQGEAARINSHGKIERIFQVHGDAIGNAWSTLDRLNGGVIKQVWDNFGATKSVSYYQILTENFKEDSPAYVDHPHEWNSTSAAGLPEYLKGVDYVRTVNDYRYISELSLHVEFADNATLYVLFDNRVAVPAWLSSQFGDTGDDVGLDEDAWDGNPSFAVETGAGRSIDNTFSIWSRNCSRDEVLVLGSMGVGKEARAMYGLAAKRR